MVHEFPYLGLHITSSRGMSVDVHKRVTKRHAGVIGALRKAVFLTNILR